ncbi:uncharacterized protein LOC141529547 [Cotesia typhae]|uniref:uncharacterized protein LOC141529547 n=1 Tax=Cotesia typhae TaxID=2053667 RepID=UPI003D69A54B
MYTCETNFEGYGTWYQMALMVYGERDLRRAVRLLAGLARPIHPREALFLASCLVTLFGSLPPEVVEAVVFFGFQDLVMVAEDQDFEEVLAPNHEDIDRLRIALLEAIFNGLVTMG